MGLPKETPSVKTTMLLNEGLGQKILRSRCVPSWQTMTNWMVREQGSRSNFLSPAMQWGSLKTLNISRCREQCRWHLNLGSTTLFRLRFLFLSLYFLTFANKIITPPTVQHTRLKTQNPS
ncbi:hypothetical protein AQUCO_08600029v1 [Aquilegia coerulea]|uniref:Uncharacterized protein n=1 Tax=Aquilegia coerulea TaxID=218851 RepID=A0A2G5C7W6_AQUCA|nr:hypothetical protein AQUCO_08600029v1 [Aquilegia coerulea]